MTTIPARASAELRRWLPLLVCALLLPAACSDVAGPDAPPAMLQFDAEALMLQKGRSQHVTVALRDAAGNTQPVPDGVTIVWSTSDPAVATVSNGVVTALATGHATIRANSTKHGPATVGVTVIDGFVATSLGTMGGLRSNAWAVNSAGMVAGWSDVGGGRSFRWSEAADMSDLLGLDSGIRGINSAGAITGYYRNASGTHGFVFQNGVTTDLPPLAPGHVVVGTSINAAGSVAGTSSQFAVVWTRAADGSYGAPVSSGLRVTHGVAAINDDGTVAFSTRVDGLATPVLWRRAPGGSYSAPHLLARPLGGDYEVLAINNGGVLVGFRWTGVNMMAVVWNPSDYDAPRDLSEGQAWGINSQNQIVGTSGGDLPVFGGAPRRPALWTLGAQGNITGPVDLGTPQGHASGGARDISDNGWIVGSSWGPGNVVATLWRPAS
jgi:hypothetical protein